MTIFLEIKTPGNGKTYEFRIDGGITAEQAKRRIIDEIIEAEDGNITLNPDSTALYDIDTQKAVPGRFTLAASDVKSGHVLLLL